MPRTVYYAAMSLDGFIADVRGGVDWLEPFDSTEFGYDAFFATIGAVVMGRTTYEQSLTFGPWPYAERLGIIVTSRPLDGLPEGVRAVHLDALSGALDALRAEASGDLWIVGGGRTAQACIDRDRVDELELYVIPRLLGDGVPLLERRDALARLQLIEARAFSNGVVRTRYRLER